MDKQRIVAGLERIAERYPTLAGLLRRKVKPGERKQVGASWIAGLANLDDGRPTAADHFDNVCDEFADWRHELPDPLDRLPFVIRQMVIERADRDLAQFEQHCEQVRYAEIKRGNNDAREWTSQKLHEHWKRGIAE